MRDYINCIRACGLVADVYDADWRIELGALTELNAFSANPTTLVFDKIRDYAAGFRVATNLYCTQRHQALGLGLPDTFAESIWSIAGASDPRRFDPVPQYVTDGPIRENIDRGDAVDVTKFPVPLWHEHDGGRFFGTGDLAITRDPIEKWVNLAPYRAQVHDPKTLGLFVGPATMAA